MLVHAISMMGDFLYWDMVRHLSKMAEDDLARIFSEMQQIDSLPNPRSSAGES